MELLFTRKRIIIIIAIFILLLIVVVISLQNSTPPVSEKSIVAPEITKNTQTIDGIANLSRNGLSQSQSKKIQSALFVFSSTLEGSPSLSIDGSSISESFDDVDKHYVFSFTVVSSRGVSYIIKVLHLKQNDAFVTVYDASNNPIYTEPSD